MNYLAVAGIKGVIHPGMITPERREQMAFDIIDAVCKYYSIGQDAILGNRGKDKISYIRFVCMWLIIQRVRGLSLGEIGMIFGGRDHSTVIHARNKINAWYYSSLEADYVLALKYDIQELLKIV
jgi:chromosomal replication initiation ATPase DnaA